VKNASAQPLVLVDATAISAQRGGVGRYVEELVRESALAGLSLVVVCQPRDAKSFADLHCDLVVAPRSVETVFVRFLWEQLGLPSLARRLRATTIHSPHYTFPFFTRRHRAVTIHDLTFWSHPDRHSTVKRLFFKFWIVASARMGLDVIVPSAATGAEYQRVTRAKVDNITVAFHGVDRDAFHPPTPRAIAKFAKANHAASWIAFLGTIEPRKNVVALIEGFQLATRDMMKRPSLLLAGAPGWDGAVTGAISRAADNGYDVRHLGYIPLDDLPAFLGGAVVAAYPSEGEGFGLPVLEAMSCGAPVLTSRSLSLPEVGGDAVAYSDTTPEGIGRGLTELLADESRRTLMSTAGLTRAVQFTWSKCLAAHRAVWGL
jgi:glycosyltransferase involved in cell wall biosynthesis